MKTVVHTNPRQGNETLHVETRGCIVNIRVGLHNTEGQEVTHIEILADKYAGEEWALEGSVNNRVIHPMQTLKELGL